MDFGLLTFGWIKPQLLLDNNYIVLIYLMRLLFFTQKKNLPVKGSKKDYTFDSISNYIITLPETVTVGKFSSSSRASMLISLPYRVDQIGNCISFICRDALKFCK